MRITLVCVGVVAAACLMSACGGPTVVNERPVDLTALLPATLEAPRPKDGDPRTVHVRVYADTAIRLLPTWKDDIADQIDYANQLLTPLVGVKLVVDEVKEWERDGTAPQDALRTLSELDKADKVTWVLGYVAPLDERTNVLGELGDARPLGRHVIVRGWDEKAETDKLASSLPDMKAGARAEVVAAHRRHKQTIVLLHGLATTLGAIAETDPTWIQNLTYAPKQSAFSDRNRELIDLAIGQRLEDAEDAVIARKLTEAIEKSEWGGWVAGERDLVLAALRLVLDQKKAGKTADDIPPAAFEQWARIKELRKANPKDALIELDNLLAAYPANATMHQFKCDLMLTKPGVTDPATRAACTRVAELAPGDPSPHLAVGEALARAKDVKSARVELAQAEAKIGNLASGADVVWKRLVGIYHAMGALTWTENAIAKGKLTDEPIAAQVAQTRARYGVPKGTKVVAPDAEGLLVAATQAALALVYADKFGEADRALTAAEKKWANAPGLIAVRCDLALRQNQVEPARAACKRAISLHPEASWALYLAGVIDLKDAGTTKAGIAKLEKAIAADPELGQAWRTLAKALARDKDSKKLEILAKAYQAKFGSPLPP
ncbi:MAG: hypothetical protein H0T79_16530 [Deltaproteobacteria bacterium]|nr:hypothetical protein [Deltaproteobacteria bacterium]